MDFASTKKVLKSLICLHSSQPFCSSHERFSIIRIFFSGRPLLAINRLRLWRNSWVFRDDKKTEHTNRTCVSFRTKRARNGFSKAIRRKRTFATNALKLYHRCEGDEQIKYVDFTSLYPHVNRSLFTDDHIGCTLMAHNFQGYDSYFVLQCLREQGVKYDVIMRGGKTRRFPC